MTGSAQHELAQFLSFIFQPVLDLYSTNCVKNSFTFARIIRNLSPESTFLCSFDINSLFTNVPLDETINICAEALYNSDLTFPSFSKDTFCQIMAVLPNLWNSALTTSCANRLMVLPWAVLLALLLRIFLWDFMNICFLKTSLNLFCISDTSMTLVPFSAMKRNAINFFRNSMPYTHPWSLLTKKKINNSLSFLNVLVEKANKKFLTSVYRKPTFTGQYTHWDSFGRKKRKTNLIGTFVHRALEICSPEKLSYEVCKIKNILRQNGYPENVINFGIKKKISNFQTPKRFVREKCPVYLKLPWIENIFLKYEKQAKSAVNNCFESVSTRIIFSSKKMLPSFQKDVLPAHKRSNIVYKYLCHCDSVYVGRTSQRLEEQIRQHVPKFIRNQVTPQKDLPTRSSGYWVRQMRQSPQAPLFLGPPLDFKGPLSKTAHTVLDSLQMFVQRTILSEDFFFFF